MSHVSLPVTAEAKVRLRLLRARLGQEAAAIELAACQVPARLVSDVRGAFGRRADAAMDAIARHIPVPTMVRERRSAVWRYLRPAGTPELPRVQVAAVLLNTCGAGLAVTAFSLSATEHALGRLLDRTLLRADPVAALLEAHDALAVLEVSEGNRLFDLPAFSLPAAAGIFLVRPGDGVGFPDAIARTWIDPDQLFPDQEAHAAAWAQITQPAAPAA